jgi:ABC-type bacteriocin/lantibiotic exporter with double-glycine peptidase domain
MMNRWLWTCPILAILVSAAVLFYYGLTLTTAVVAALIMVCPAVMIWGALQMRETPAEKAAKCEKQNKEKRA